MPTPASDQQGVGGAAKQVAQHASALLKLELELAGLELKRKVAALGVGAGLAIGGLVFALFGLGFLFATIAAALAELMDTWLALLIVTLFLFMVAGLLAMLGLGRIRKGTPPVPEQAIAEARLTSMALKSDGSRA